jgi:hypothetical protein
LKLGFVQRDPDNELMYDDAKYSNTFIYFGFEEDSLIKGVVLSPIIKAEDPKHPST